MVKLCATEELVSNQLIGIPMYIIIGQNNSVNLVPNEKIMYMPRVSSSG